MASRSPTNTRCWNNGTSDHCWTVCVTGNVHLLTHVTLVYGWLLLPWMHGQGLYMCCLRETSSNRRCVIHYCYWLHDYKHVTSLHKQLRQLSAATTAGTVTWSNGFTWTIQLIFRQQYFSILMSCNITRYCMTWNECLTQNLSSRSKNILLFSLRTLILSSKTANSDCCQNLLPIIHYIFFLVHLPSMLEAPFHVLLAFAPVHTITHNKYCKWTYTVVYRTTDLLCVLQDFTLSIRSTICLLKTYHGGWQYSLHFQTSHNIQYWCTVAWSPGEHG